MKITALNGKEYDESIMTKEYGEVLRKSTRYYYFSRRACRMMPLAKADFQKATII
jgi:hypothetical protein